MSALVCLSPSHAEKPGSALTLPPTAANIHTLDNGLTIIIESDPSAPVASLQAWVATGSIHEGKWLGAGLSHILEHMLFKGTETRGAGDIARAIQDQGGYINAYTTFDRTVYWIDVPSAGVSEALEILCDAMMHSTLPEDEYVKEQEVIRREFAMGFDDPNRQGIQLLLRTLYPQTPYGIPVIGHLDVFNQLTRDDVLEYYRQRYVPNNITFVITGDVDEKAVLAQLNGFFADIPRGALEPVLVLDEPAQIGRREAHEEFATELSRLFLAWRVPGLDHPDAPALEILGSILGSGRSSILNREIRERRELAHSIGAGVYSTQQEGVFYISALADPDNRATVEEETLAAIGQIQDQGVSEEEVEKARNGMLADLLGSLTTARGKASSHGSNWMLTRNLDFGRHFLETMAGVSAADVQRVARDYLVPDQITVTSLNPLGSITTVAEAAEASEASPVQSFTLDNGLRLLVREDPRLPLVSMTAAFRGGVLAESPENNGITRLLAQTLLKGTKTRPAEQLAEEIESSGGSISAEAGSNTYSVSVDVLAPQLDKGLEILADVLLHPTFPEREVALEKSAQIAAIKAEDDQITSVASNLLRQRLFGEHPYSLRATGTEESVTSLSRNDLQQFHTNHTVAKNGVLAVFGDVKAEEVLAAVEKYFSALPAGELALTDPPESSKLAERVEARKDLDKQQAVVMVGFRGSSVTDPDRPALELLSSASSDLGSRFFDRIREQMGLAYFVGAAQSNGLAPGMFVFYVGTDPAKVDQVSEALNEEIAKLAMGAMTGEELQRAKMKMLGAEAIRNQSNAAKARSSSINELVGLGYDHSERRAEEINKVTLEDIHDVARRYFQDPRPVEITVGPANSKPPAAG
jgi:zinc protease